MGGDFEGKTAGGNGVGGTISSSPAPVDKEVVLTVAAPLGPTLRYHKNGNEIHFHDDLNKIKAVVPAAEFYHMARRVRAGKTSVYFDKKNSSLLTLFMTVGFGSLDYIATLDRVNVGTTAVSLENFFSQLGI